MITFLKWYYVTLSAGLIDIGRDWFRLISSQFAIGVMWQNITQPLYQDYTYSGRIIGFLIRMARIIIGLIIEGLIIFVLVLIFILWLFLPLLALYKVLTIPLGL